MTGTKAMRALALAFVLILAVGTVEASAQKHDSVVTPRKQALRGAVVKSKASAAAKSGSAAARPKLQMRDAVRAQRDARIRMPTTRQAPPVAARKPTVDKRPKSTSPQQ